ncbi:MAG: ROK family protein [Geobacter sp.]|nr:ROK family protein [Geobacter sp.]
MSGGAAAVGIDIGGTNLRFALVTADGDVCSRLRLPTETTRAGFLHQLTAGIRELQQQAPQLGCRLVAAGAGMPGLVTRSGEILSSVNLPHCEGVNLARELAQSTALPAVVGNDANVAACGEQRFGAGRPYRSFLMVTLGTGVGGGLILDGRLWTGSDGFAGEFGHMTVEPDGRPCPCGNRGCLEQYASATALVAGAGRCLGIAAAGVINLLNIEAIVVGGGVAASFPLWGEAMRREIHMRGFRPAVARVAVVRIELGDDAGVLGAAALAFADYDAAVETVATAE